MRRPGKLCCGGRHRSGIVPASLEYPYNVATTKGFKEQAEERGAKAVAIDPCGSVEKQAYAIDDLMGQRIKRNAALIMYGVVSQSWADKLAEADVPFVSVATVIGDTKTRTWNDVYHR